MALPELFTGTNGAELHVYDPLWVTHPTTTGIFEINANRAVLRDTPYATGLYIYNQQPVSADYDVSSTINTTNPSVIGGVVGRCDPSAATYYLARWNTGQVQLYKSIAGTLTLLGGVAQAMTNGVDYKITLSMSGSTIRLLFDDVQKINVTDTAITAIGYAGIRSNGGSSIFYYDNFDVTNMSGGASAVFNPTAANAVGAYAAKVSPLSIFNSTTAGASGSFVASTGAAQALYVATTAGASGAYVATGTASGATLVSEALFDYAGNRLNGVTLNFVRIYNDTTGALVVTKTGVVTNSLGVFFVTDAALSSGMTYRIDWETAAGQRRMPRKAAA